MPWPAFPRTACGSATRSSPTSTPTASSTSRRSRVSARVRFSISVDQPRDGLAAVRAVIESGGEAVTVPDDEILAAIGELASTAGVFAEPAAAAPWAAAKQLAGNDRIGKDETVVLLITGSGLKDVASLPASKPELVDVDFNIDDLAARQP